MKILKTGFFLFFIISFFNLHKTGLTVNFQAKNQSKKRIALQFILCIFSI